MILWDLLWDSVHRLHTVPRDIFLSYGGTSGNHMGFSTVAMRYRAKVANIGLRYCSFSYEII